MLGIEGDITLHSCLSPSSALHQVVDTAFLPPFRLVGPGSWQMAFFVGVKMIL